MNISYEDKLKFDRSVREILSRKKFIAPILQRTVPGYDKLSLKEIEERLPGKGEKIDFDDVENLDPNLKQNILSLVFSLE